MTANLLLAIHPLLTDRVRLAIMAALLSSRSGLNFNSLLAVLEVTRGNLSAHLRKLEEGELIEVTKEFVDRKPRSTYRCSRTGRAELKSYLRTVESALKQAPNNEKKN